MSLILICLGIIGLISGLSMVLGARKILVDLWGGGIKLTNKQVKRLLPIVLIVSVILLILGLVL